ncbi:alpha/beta hydrolase [Rhizorhapis suberifaciens]|uniref:Acetyl esterase n=1 Tax=Rhizorhapis suberifaciens TaxID=13656 RepID=A0A840HVB4_9SPHN|nr:alpha/beta hydrolase [Rhizorhapis suberifaciens]MBB4641995.1 acetyl esterase [Rhizorhapis suberifaciens]
MRDMGQLADVAVGELAVIRDLSCKGPAGEIPLRLFDARSHREKGPALVFFHGGGFVLGDFDTHAPFCAEAARQLDMPVIAVDYRLAPEHPFPAAPLDCEAAARWVAASPPELGFDVTAIALCGDSAGGLLSIVTSMALRDEPAQAPVLAQFSIYPATDLKNRYRSNQLFAEGYFIGDAEMKWFDQCYAADMDQWRASPLMGSQNSMPPTLIVTAGLDPLRDQGRRYAKACIEQGVPLTYREARGNIHGFINLAKAIPSSVDDIREGLALFKNMVRHQAERLGSSMSEGLYGR